MPSEHGRSTDLFARTVVTEAQRPQRRSESATSGLSADSPGAGVNKLHVEPALAGDNKAFDFSRELFTKRQPPPVRVFTLTAPRPLHETKKIAPPITKNNFCSLRADGKKTSKAGRSVLISYGLLRINFQSLQSTHCERFQTKPTARRSME